MVNLEKLNKSLIHHFFISINNIIWAERRDRVRKWLCHGSDKCRRNKSGFRPHQSAKRLVRRHLLRALGSETTQESNPISQYLQEEKKKKTITEYSTIFHHYVPYRIWSIPACDIVLGLELINMKFTFFVLIVSWRNDERHCSPRSIAILKISDIQPYFVFYA